MNNVTSISFGGVGTCNFPRVRSGIGKSHCCHSVFGLSGRSSQPLFISRHLGQIKGLLKAMGTRELHLRVLTSKSQGSHAAEQEVPSVGRVTALLLLSCVRFRQPQGGSSEMAK